MRSISILLQLLFATLALPALAQGPKWITYANGHQINDYGFEGDDVWVGTDAGLTKINKLTGKQLHFLPSNSGIKGFGVSAIYIDSFGTKWLGGTQGGLMSFSDSLGWGHYYLTTNGDTLTGIRTLKPRPNGELWILGIIRGSCYECTKLLKFDGNALTIMNDAFGVNLPFPDYPSVQEFDIAPNGDIWAFTGYSIEHFDGTNIVASYPFDSTFAEYEYPYRIHARGDNEVLVVTTLWASHNIWKFDGSQWAPTSIAGIESFNQTPDRFIKDPNGNTWLTTYASNQSGTNMYCKYDGSQWQVWYADQLPNTPIGDFGEPLLLRVDEAGHWWSVIYTYWFEQTPTAFEYDGASWTGYDTGVFPISVTNDIAFDCYGKTWLGGYNLTRFDGINWAKYSAAEMGIPNSENVDVVSMALDTATCSLWMCVPGDANGSSFLVKHTADGVFTAHPVPNAGIPVKVLVGKNNEVWVATNNIGLAKFDGANWTWFDGSNSPAGNFSYAMDMDKQGRLWVSSYDAPIAVYDGNDWSIYNADNSPITDIVSMLFVDNDDQVWALGLDSLRRFDGVVWTSFPLPDYYYECYDMKQDENGDYWLATQDGAYRFNEADGYQLFNVFNSRIGNSTSGNIRIDSYNNKWFSHPDGVSVYNANGIPGRLFNPPNSVQGRVFFDTDQNGSFDPANEPTLTGQKVTLLPDNTVTFSSAGGYYKLYPSFGTHQISFQPTAPYVSTTATTLDLLMGNDDQTGFDFGAWAPVPPDSVRLELTTSASRCFGVTSVWMEMEDYEDYEGTLTLAFDPLVSFFSAEPAPTSINGNSLVWDFSTIKTPGHGHINLVFQNPGVEAVGQWLDFVATAILQDGSQTVTDIAASEVICSYDPNDKRAEPTGASIAPFSLLDDALDYTIRFQNKGNDTAFTVVIRDTLDLDLAPASFELLASSHPVRLTLEQGGILSFYFDQINLLWESFNEAASHGFVKYRISPKPGLPDPTDIHNTAHIYFDFNPAIVTNTTENILVETLPFLGTKEQAHQPVLSVYPNPSNGNFWMEMAAPGNWDAAIFDPYGRKLRSFSVSGNKFEVAGLQPGVYWVNVKQAGHVVCGKMVVVVSDK